MLTLQQEMAPRPLLGQLLLDEKLVTSHELNTLLGKYQRMHLLGDVLVETKAITAGPAGDRPRGPAAEPPARSARS